MTVVDILKQWLKANGYDGLVDDSGECGCDLRNLIPCENSIDRCLPAYRGPGLPDSGYDCCMYSSKEARDRAAQTQENAE